MSTKDYFKQDILEDAISENQKGRKAKREIQKAKQQAKVERKQAVRERLKMPRKVFLIVLGVLVIVLALFSSRILEISRLTKEKAEAQAKLDAINSKIAQLEDELSRVQSPEYIEQQARNQLRMIYPGEILYVVLDKK